eukprot:TRINITY_DN8816_c0_g1_i4.p1 TRINITY_DN8816_c0_g1~~TRINITY_DN8816_c0_g1_i4.p1  ORF type:complete len:441 (-),score=157.44 TRINITY_DN8816_c0_g1_i4:223-1545(-)
MERAMPELMETQDPITLGHGLYVLAMVNMLLGDVAGAPKHFQTALDLREWCEAMPKKAEQARQFVERCRFASGGGRSAGAAESYRQDQDARKAAREVRLAAKRQEMREEEEALEREIKERQERRRRAMEMSDSDDELVEEEPTKAEAVDADAAIRAEEAAAAQKKAEHETKEAAAKKAEAAAAQRTADAKKAAAAKKQAEEETAAAKKKAEEAAAQRKAADRAAEEEAAAKRANAKAEDMMMKKPTVEEAVRQMAATTPAIVPSSSVTPESDKERRARFEKLMAERQRERQRRTHEAEEWAAAKLKHDSALATQGDPAAAPQREEPCSENSTSLSAAGVVVPESPAKCRAAAGSGSRGNQPAWYAEWLEEENLLVLEICLAGVENVSELELDCNEEELEVCGGGFHLQLAFGGQMDDESIGAKFDAATHKLTVSLHRLRQ